MIDFECLGNWCLRWIFFKRLTQKSWLIHQHESWIPQSTNVLCIKTLISSIQRHSSIHGVFSFSMHVCEIFEEPHPVWTDLWRVPPGLDKDRSSFSTLYTSNPKWLMYLCIDLFREPWLYLSIEILSLILFNFGASNLDSLLVKVIISLYRQYQIVSD